VTISFFNEHARIDVLALFKSFYTPAVKQAIPMTSVQMEITGFQFWKPYPAFVFKVPTASPSPDASRFCRRAYPPETEG